MRNAPGPMGSSLVVGSVTDSNHAAEELTATQSADCVTACEGTAPSADGTTPCEVAVPAGAC
jgi:hypothetical protein